MPLSRSPGCEKSGYGTRDAHRDQATAAAGRSRPGSATSRSSSTMKSSGMRGKHAAREHEVAAAMRHVGQKKPRGEEEHDVARA